MTRETIIAQHVMIDRVNRYTEKGWRFEPDADRVRVYPPAEIRKQFELVDRTIWVAGANYQEALAFVDGFTKCIWIVKNKG